MILKFKQKLIREVKRIINTKDPSHDLFHAMRVLANAEHIAKFEGGKLDIIIPAALFHDIIVYPKDNPNSKNAPKESAKVAEKILKKFSYNHLKIQKVKEAIIEHSYSSGLKAKTIESRILQDADKLEATGAISIMRTFCSTGQMKRGFYNNKDPFCKSREPNAKIYALDLFYKRLLKVKELMNTKTAKQLAKQRTKFLHAFLKQLKEELKLITP